MSNGAIAALIWLGTSVVLAVLVLPGLVMVFMHDRAGWSLITWIDVLIPNLVLIFVPSGLTAAAFWLIANRVRRD